MPYRLLDRAGLRPAVLENLDALIALDLEAPTAAELALVKAFAAGGKLLFDRASLGAGAADPYAVSLEALTRMGRNNQGARLFNVSPILSYLSESRGGAAALLQLVNYAGAPVERVTARAGGSFRKAVLHQPGMPPAELPLEGSGGMVEFLIPQVSISAAVLLE